jgi:hypothetical protein
VPIELTFGVQTIPTIAAKKSVKLASTTNFGQKITYKASGNCSIMKNTLSAKKGTCTVTATAAGQAGLFAGLSTKVVLNIK